MPKIFIYTPTYNRGSILIERSVRTVLAQTYKNFVYFVVGDCCTDDTAALMNKISDPRIRFVNLSKRCRRYPPTAEHHWFAGPVVAANYALSHIDGKCSWIARIDDDDQWVEDHIESSLNFALEGNWEFVTSNTCAVRYGKQYLEPGEYLYGEYFRERLQDTSRYVYNPRIGATSTLLYRTYLSYFRYNIDCWRGKHNRVNDVNLYHRLGTAGVRMGYLDKINVIIQPRPGEETIGMDAYKANAEKMKRHFQFH
jgi:glycosyltransferase involved in cell wall biosynthesis